MAEQKRKTQAERAAAAGKKKAVKKPTSGKPTEKGKSEKKQETKQRMFPVRLIMSVIFLGVFILLLVMFLKPSGALITLLRDLIQGLLGKTGFLIAIPISLYLFVIHAFFGDKPVVMRSICLGLFVLSAGCLAHIFIRDAQMPSGMAMVSELYRSGVTGTSGGVICGLLGELLHWLCGTIISSILLIVSAVFTLLAGMQITIPSIIRAVQERPRADWEEEEKEERQEPASVVVNHIANKRIAHKEKQRLRAAQRASEEEESIPITTPVPTLEKGSEVIRQIGGDTEAPVIASTGTVPTRQPAASRIPEVDPDLIPCEMPPLVTEAAEPAPMEAKPKKVTAQETRASAELVAQEIEQASQEEKPAYSFPPLNLLRPSGLSAGDGTAEMRDNTRRLNETLASFKIDAHIINVTRGPSVTRYEVELEKGVRLNRLTNAADDIALSLGAVGVRIAAVPGKISVVGIEVPNRAVSTVALRDVIDSPEFSTAKSRSSFAVGKDIDGNCIVGNIAKLPHMLIAGTTGSGKSVCMNSIIISLLYKASPDDVKLIMVDPKMVELGIYNGIPHLLIPVVTDPKKAAGALQWAVTEMMRRYAAMSELNVRDLESYNSIVEGMEEEGTKLPQIVVIVDELADLMLVAAKEVEESICRIAQMGRAAGVHLIIATQRPSADVITGLMKANIPSRIAFAVASAMESRIILDTQGAEKLVGKGDMLYAPFGSGKPKRVQGCFVSDPEVEAVATHVKSNFTTNYDQQVMEEIEKKAIQTGNNKGTAEPEPNSDELEGDELLPAAVDVVLEIGQASTSMLQRRLKLGYSRAARIVDEMEEKGIVGPYQGSKPRSILITKEQWEVMRSGGTAQMQFEDLDEDPYASVPDVLD